MYILFYQYTILTQCTESDGDIETSVDEDVHERCMCKVRCSFWGIQVMDVLFDNQILIGI